MVLFIETESAEVAEQSVALNKIVFEKDAEGRHCALVHIERTALKRQSASTLRQQIEGGLTDEDRQNFIFAFCADLKLITIGVHYNPHAHRDLYRKIGTITESIRKYTGITVVVDITTFPK